MRSYHNQSVNGVLIKNQKAEALVHTVDSMDLIVIFTLALQDSFKWAFEAATFYTFGAAGLLAVARFFLTLRRAWLDKTTNSWLQAGVEFLTAAAVSTAVVFSLIFKVTLGSFAPFIFAATLGAKAVFHAASAIFFWSKSLFHPDYDVRVDASKKAFGNLVSFIVLAAVVPTVALVLIVAKPVWSLLGIAAGVIGTLFGIKQIYDLCKSQASTIDSPNASSSPRLSSSPSPQRLDEPAAVSSPRPGLNNNNHPSSPSLKAVRVASSEHSHHHHQHRRRKHSVAAAATASPENIRSSISRHHSGSLASDAPPVRSRSSRKGRPTALEMALGSAPQSSVGRAEESSYPHSPSASRAYASDLRSQSTFRPVPPPRASFSAARTSVSESYPHSPSALRAHVSEMTDQSTFRPTSPSRSMSLRIDTEEANASSYAPACPPVRRAWR